MPEVVRCPQCGAEIPEDDRGDGICPRCLLGLGLEATLDDQRVGPGARTHLAGYEILAPLGTGGMGRVYRARDRELGRDVAVKVLPDEFSRDPDRIARFRREARILASLNHAHIATIYGLERDQGLHCLVMELVEGRTLADHLATGPLPVQQALDLAIQIADALEAAHESGIVHRDLKPANVMVTPKGRVKILDFGIAKITGAAAATDATALTAEGTLVGTTPYMSPEQVRGQAVDERSDIWSFGCVLFEVLTGKRAFDQQTAIEIFSAILEREPDLAHLPPQTPRAVRDLVATSLRKDPDQRLRTMSETKRVLEQARSRGGDAGRRSAAAIAVAAVALGAVAWIIGPPARWSDSLSGFVVQRLSDGGTVALLLLCVLVVAAAVWRGAKRATSRLWRAGARSRLALLILATYGPLLGAALVAERLWAAVVLAAGGSILWTARAWLSVPPGRRWSFAAVQVVLLVAAWQVGGSWDGRAGQRLDETLDVYVVLPFEKLDDERDEELLEISEHYRSTLASVFSDLETVRVMPRLFDPEVMRSHPPQCSYRRVLEWLGESELSPDVVLCSTVDLFDDEAAHPGVVLVSRVKRVRDEELEPMSAMIKQTGTYSDITWLALKTSFQIVLELMDDPAIGLSPEDGSKVKRRILEAYGVFLSFRDPAGGAAARVAQNLEAGTLSDADLKSTLDAYRSPLDLSAYAARNQAARSVFRRRVLGEPQPDPLPAQPVRDSPRSQEGGDR